MLSLLQESLKRVSYKRKFVDICKEVQDEVEDPSVAEMPVGMNLKPPPKMVVDKDLYEKKVQEVALKMKQELDANSSHVLKNMCVSKGLKLVAPTGLGKFLGCEHTVGAANNISGHLVACTGQPVAKCTHRIMNYHLG